MGTGNKSKDKAGRSGLVKMRLPDCETVRCTGSHRIGYERRFQDRREIGKKFKNCTPGCISCIIAGDDNGSRAGRGGIEKKQYLQKPLFVSILYNFLFVNSDTQKKFKIWKIGGWKKTFLSSEIQRIRYRNDRDFHDIDL